MALGVDGRKSPMDRRTFVGGAVAIATTSLLEPAAYAQSHPKVIGRLQR